MKNIYPYLLLLLFIHPAQAQNHFCGTDSVYSLPQNTGKKVFREAAKKEILKWRSNHKGDFNRYKPSSNTYALTSFDCEQATFYLPVVVHIIHLKSDSLPGMGSNISDAQVANALELLNRGFGNANGYNAPAVNTGIKFCLATRKPDGTSFSGIIRNPGNVSNHTFDSIKQLTNISYFPSTNYLNIYVVNNILTPSGNQTGILGYAHFPEIGLPQDGVVMRAFYFGDYQTCTECYLNTNSKGRILVHEMGHYLGVYHPFEGSCAGNKLSTCSSSGDYCCDVPQIRQPTTSCNNLLTSDCYNPQIQVQINNFMDYAPDACAYFFTNDQADLMAATLNTIRRNLCSRQNLDSTGVKCCIRTAWFSSDRLTLCQDSLVNFFANKYINHQYSWKIFRNDTFVTTLSDTLGKNQFYAAHPGKYSVWLKITDGTDTISQYRSSLFTVGNCTKKLKSHNGNWYFGDHAGVTFYEFAPLFDPGPRLKEPNIKNSEGSICISDSAGNLLFYAGRRQSESDTTFVIFNKDYKKINNPNIYGHESSAQGGVAFKVPGNSSKYYIITTGQNIDGGGSSIARDLRYNIVDMNLGSGLGDVVFGQKNNPIKNKLATFLNSADSCVQVNESINAVPSCNDSFVWVATLGTENTGPFNGPEPSLMIYKATANGISHHKSYKLPVDPIASSHLAFSPDGRHIGSPYFVADFDPASGVAFDFKFNYEYLFIITETPVPNEACFSPDGSKLYFTKSKRDSIPNIGLYVINVADLRPFYTPELIMKIPGDNSILHGLQLGPDGKMYLGIAGTEYLSAITNPNEEIENLEIDLTSVYLGTGMMTARNLAGLPNTIDATYKSVSKLNFTFTREGCLKLKFNGPNRCASGIIQWDFGDGTQDTGQYVTHEYNISGEYNVKLKMGNDSIFKTITTGIRASEINGDKLICDTSSVSLYSITNRPGAIYKWSAINGTASAFNNDVFVKWNDTTGQLSLILLDSAIGCYDTASITIHKIDSIYNNAISTELNTCHVVLDSFVVNGSKAGGVGISPNYYWYWKGVNDTLWKTPYLFQGKTGIFQYRDSIYQLMRITQAGQCYGMSNIVDVPKFKILNVLDKGNFDCTPVSTLPYNTKASGVLFNPVYISNPTIKHQLKLPISVAWQLSADSLNWQEKIIKQVLEHNYNVTTFDSFMQYRKLYLRRTLSCDDYSNVSNTVIFNRPFFIKQPTGKYDSCTKSILLIDSVSVDWHNSVQKSYSFQIHNGIGWKQIYTSTSGKLNTTYSDFNYGTTLYRVVARFNYCDSIISDTASIAVSGGSVKVLEIYANLNSQNGRTLKLALYKSSTIPLYKIIWYKSRNPEGGIWDSIGNSNSDSFEIQPNLTFCQQKWYYRAKLINQCSVSSTYSDILEIGTFTSTNPIAEFWIPDSRRDQGIEPNWIDSQNYTGSYYLYTRNWATKGNRVWDWTDRENVQWDRDTNWIHCVIYNRGNAPAAEGKVHFYWTVMSINEDWPYSWTGLAKFKNQDPNNTLSYNHTYPLGNRINKTGIELADVLNQTPEFIGHAPYAGQLQPGDSVLISYPWTHADTIPMPGWYYGTTANSSRIRYANTVGMCILARISTCDSQANGMTYPEKLNLGLDKPVKNYGNIGYNIVRNNKIASANFYLGYMSPPFSDTVQVWTLGAPPPADSSNGVADVYYTFCGDNPTYFTNAEVQMVLNDAVWDAFVTAGYPGTGFYTANSNEIVITDPCATIGPIRINDTLQPYFGINFRYKPGNNPNGTSLSTEFEFKQFKTTGEMVGMCSYGVHSMSNGSGGNGQNGDQPMLKSSKTQVLNSITVFPNPIENQVTIRVNAQLNDKFSAQLFDAAGRLVHNINNETMQSNGRNDFFINSQSLSPGVYWLEMQLNNNIKTKKIVKISN